MSQPNRLSNFDKFNRNQPINFIFNGQHFQGYIGDTLASALLANGVKLVGRSFKYHRPRGIMGVAAEETNALVQLEPETAQTLPNIQATKIELYEGLKATSVNCWPSPEFDLMACISFFHRILPAGFYYKTFMWPKKAWRLYEYFIRRAAGLGKSPMSSDPDYYDKMNIHCDVLIVGGGPAGVAAAIASGETGAQVILVDEQISLGGQLLNEAQNDENSLILNWLKRVTVDLKKLPNLKILTKTTAFGFYDHNLVGLIETRKDNITSTNRISRQRLWRVRPKQIILATGATERPLIFPDNDRPGIMLSSACRAYINRYGVAPGKNIIVFTNNDDAYRTAIDLVKAGIKVPAIIDIRTAPISDLPNRATELGIEILENMAISRVIGVRAVKAVEIMALDSTHKNLIGDPIQIQCDGIVSSGGWNPVIHLHSQSAGKSTFDADRGIYLPDENTASALFAGAVKGSFNLVKCLTEGDKAGRRAGYLCGYTPAKKRRKFPKITCEVEDEITLLWSVPTSHRGEKPAKQFIDLQNDVTASDIELAAREGYKSIEHTKRYTTLGMATDQGKTGNIPGMAILARAIGLQNPGDVGTTTFRPPYTPVTIGALAGRYIGDFLSPIRKTPLHLWHEQARCEWEDVGEWKRPWYYPKANESKLEALNRECLSARTSIGMLDASTLGKIDIKGPDAAEFLDLIYTNSWSDLKIGHCRYGLMLKEDGMVMDDGVTARLGKNHFLMTTTTGNAAKVLVWLEEWLQTEWPTLEVFCTSVTEHWATISLCGPKTRTLLSEFPSNIDFSAKSFPFMTTKEGTIAGIPARIFRISFTGETSFEINVPSSYALSLWTQLFNAGQKYGLTPYGTESMHILRAEKGYIIVGQETDGTVNPNDLNMNWIVSKKKDFIGKRSLTRSDSCRQDRKQLVGLLPENTNEVIIEGSQIIEDSKVTFPMPMLGHVTSSYYSPNLNCSFALAMLQNGKTRHGEHLYLYSYGKIVRALVTSPKFFDPDGARLND